MPDSLHDAEPALLPAHTRISITPLWHSLPAGKVDTAAALAELLAEAKRDWNPMGRPDASGAMVGGSVALRLEELHSACPGLHDRLRQHGTPRTLHCAGQLLAFGMSSGVTVVIKVRGAGALPPHVQLAGRWRM